MRYALLGLMTIGALSGCVSKKRYDDMVLEQQQLNQQKDSLVSDVLSATQMVTEINADLARVQGLGVSPVSSTEQPVTGRAEERAIVLGKIRELISRLEAAEVQVGEQRKRVNSLTGERRKLLAQLDTFQKTIEELRATAVAQEAIVTEQREQIKVLTSRVDTLSQQTEQLEVARVALSDTLGQVTDQANAVYYAVGTEDELIKRGILVKEGSKFLVFGGKTLQPARELQPELFQKLDRRYDTVLTVPEPTKRYRIVTRQNPQFLSGDVNGDGKIKGDLHIASTEFWAGGPFLILVRD